ncbi:hypothetical protein GGS21DRAFT_123193 [Xylaria nigripes]|nr:hypothetical protein GGS21DRAFT_123193 [Xylaria nigripes]
MQLHNLWFVTLIGLGTTSSISVPTTLPTTICVDYAYPCGSPPTTTLIYGGCHDVSVPTVYKPPPCPAGSSSSNSCTSTGIICDDRFKTCGSPTPSVTLTYGACHDACVTLTYSEPPCPRASASSMSGFFRSCPNTLSVCEDYTHTCGSPPTTTLAHRR